MQSLVYSGVGVCVCVFGIAIILHHVIISFRITLHHASYRIKKKRLDTKLIFGKKTLLKWKYAEARSKLQGIKFYPTCHKKGLLSLRSMKRKEGVFSPKAQKRYVHKNFKHRKEINYKTIYILHSKPMITKYYKHSSANVTLIF